MLRVESETDAKPCIPHRVGILYGHRASALQGEDEIFRVQHIQNADMVGIELRHISSRFRKFGEEIVHLKLDIRLDKFLIPAEFGCMRSPKAGQRVSSPCLSPRIAHRRDNACSPSTYQADRE